MSTIRATVWIKLQQDQKSTKAGSSLKCFSNLSLSQNRLSILQNILATEMEDDDEAIDQNVDGMRGVDDSCCNIFQCLPRLQMGRINIEQQHVEHDGYEGHADAQPQGKHQTAVRPVPGHPHVA